MPPAIVVENLSKSYRVNHEQVRGGYRTLRESLTAAAARPINRLRSAFGSPASFQVHSTEEFWALKDINFDVQPGEVVGVIGRNGAGKSTLLKVLSRITKPTHGRAVLNGRVGSLLEVGTGFHPELTGRENIFMNGSILGMNRREIQRNFHQMVSFAEVERFIDTPVKRYSSGMQVRLAFAVAAFLQPEILIVDEVLAVGDLSFQRRCLGRMQEVSRDGRTILFVSHNMAAVESLCETGILLDEGQITAHGRVEKVIRNYFDCILARPDLNLSARTIPNSSGLIRSVKLRDSNGAHAHYIHLGGDLHLLIDLEVPGEVEQPTVGIGFDDFSGTRLLTVHTPLTRSGIPRIKGKCSLICRIPRFPLAPGDYWIKVAVSALGGSCDAVDRALLLRVTEADPFNDGRGFTKGYCIAPSDWQLVLHDS